MAKKDNSKASGGLFSKLFGPKKQRSFMEEEQLQSPGRTIVRNFVSNKLGMTGLIIFLCIFLFVMIGPNFWILDLSYQDNTQTNVPPSNPMLTLPEELVGNVADISSGTTYSAGISKDGDVYLWGYTRITETIDLADIPDEVKEANIVKIAAGYDHIVALDDKGAVYVWGNTRLGQAMLPSEMEKIILPTSLDSWKTPKQRRISRRTA